jgi:hypothetical protein
MLALVLAAAGLQAGLSGPTLAVRIAAACEQLEVDATGLTAPAALRACHEALGTEPRGPLLAQADVLAEQLGLSFEREAAVRRVDASGAQPAAPSVHAVMSAPVMVHRFSDEV